MSTRPARRVFSLVAKAMTSKMMYCLVAWALFSVNCTAEREAPPATCKGETVHAGQAGEVAYRFKADINKVQRPLSISVDFYPDIGGYENVVECYWIDSKNSGCSTVKGYSLRVLNDHDVTLHILNVSQTLAGAYAAQLMAPSDQAIVSCELKVLGPVTPETPKPTPRVTESPADPQAGETTQSLPGNRTGTDAVTAASDGGEVVVLAVAVPLVILVICVIIACVVCWKRRQNEWRINTPAEMERGSMRYSKTGPTADSSLVDNVSEPESSEPKGDKKAPARKLSMQDEIQIRSAAMHLSITQKIRNGEPPYGEKG